MEKATLYYEKRPGLTVSIKIYFNDEDGLVLDGYDHGSVVEDIKGKDDYEYCLTVEKNEVKKLYAVFAISPDNRAALLEAIRLQFSTDDAFTRFANFMKANGIEYTTFFW